MSHLLDCCSECFLLCCLFRCFLAKSREWIIREQWPNKVMPIFYKQKLGMNLFNSKSSPKKNFKIASGQIGCHQISNGNQIGTGKVAKIVQQSQRDQPIRDEFKIGYKFAAIKQKRGQSQTGALDCCVALLSFWNGHWIIQMATYSQL